MEALAANRRQPMLCHPKEVHREYHAHEAANASWFHRPYRQESLSDALELRADMLDIVLAGRRCLHHGGHSLLRHTGELALLAILEANEKAPVIGAEEDGFNDL